VPADERRTTVMSVMNRLRNAVEHSRGRARETAGRATGNRRMTARGRRMQLKSDVKRTVQKLKDGGKN
jgi:uncharacterized protein YjbJ (UPF0337 family)